MQVNQSPPNGAAASANVQHVVADRDSTQRPYSNEIFFDAIAAGDPGAVKDLLQHPEVDLTSINNAGQTPLHVAIAMGHAPIVEILLPKCGDDPRIINAPDRLGYTPLLLAAENNNLPMMQALIALRASVAHHNENCSAAVIAAKKAAAAKAEIFIDARGDKNTALKLAVQRGNVDAARLFLSAGADMWPALMAANEKQGAERLSTLVTAGANPSELLVLPMMKGWTGAAKVLIADGADVSVAFERALERNWMPAAKALLFFGADGTTALASAVERGDSRAVKHLLQIGVDASTLLKRAANDGDQKTAETLVFNGAKTFAAMMDLAREGNSRALAMLISASREQISGVVNTLAKKPEEAQAFETLLKAGEMVFRSGNFIDYEKAITTVLTDAAKARNLTLAQRLLAAGASSVPAIQNAMSLNRVMMASMLMIAGANFAVLKPHYKGNGMGPTPAEIQDFVELVTGKVSEARSLAASSDGLAIAAALVDDGTDEAALEDAVQGGDWRVVRALVGEGADVTECLTRLVEKGHVRQACQWIEFSNLAYVGVCERLFENGQTDSLRPFVLSQRDKGSAALMQAARAGNIDLAHALMTAGVNGPAVLGRAIDESQVAVAQTLFSLDVDITEAYKAAVAEKRMALANVFRLLGADLSAR